MSEPTEREHLEGLTREARDEYEGRRTFLTGWHWPRGSACHVEGCEDENHFVPVGETPDPTPDLQFAVEAAPTLLQPDGEGGVTVHPVTDEALLAAAAKVAEENGWSDEERSGLYEALVEALDALAAGEETDNE